MIKIKDLSKEFLGKEKLQVLRDIDLEINKGEFIALIGPSGCGKTTLLNITGALEEPTKGKIAFSDSSPEFGFVFQNPALLDWRTVEENIRLPLEIKNNQKNIDEMLYLVGLTKFREYYPGQLSGGMQQKAAIARALIFDPEILLMDEPFSSLDEFTREQMTLDLQKIWLRTKKTILFVTHNIEEAVFLADKVVILSNIPAITKRVIKIDIDRPRKISIKNKEVFRGYVKWIKEVLKE